ncbi:energy transducer TonB [Hymenobacter lutimineralis]|uniref:Energy transducer TonB n=1 Tax=Hymenobacter lutimineralis TaxID=2606448 RepID=A0A5D6V1J1_9BACT|nr:MULTISPECIES: energy transducer TonB [Hymenobacter]QIX61026.1 energy transducer TonB [Hymenobacter sp. BT18]TYZ09663.1 energy transducer TonB [Hymenobacter lutimineralis]
MKQLLVFFTLLMSLLGAGTTSVQAQKKLKYPKPDEDKIYEAAAQPATPVGGMEAFAQYLADKQNYPTAALQRGTQGTVVVTFVIEKSGAVSHVEPQQPLDPDLDQEAVRVIKEGPKWTPALNRGEKVRMRMNIPITFQIPADQAASPASPATTAVSAAPALPPTPAATTTPTVIKPDQPARPAGGTDAFFAWIQQNLKYPAQAKQRKVEGRVIVEFIIQKDGSLTDIKPVKRLGSGCDEEAVRLIQSAPKWLPATYQGQPIKQKMVLPVVFQL